MSGNTSGSPNTGHNAAALTLAAFLGARDAFRINSSSVAMHNPQLAPGCRR